MTTLNVRWEPAEGRVKEYKVIYVPAAGGAESMVGLVGKQALPVWGTLIKLPPRIWIWSTECVPVRFQETVSAGTSTTVLRGLQPDTLYTVSLVPVYAEGDGKTMSENGKTSKNTFT